ncbi:uncharacterized protein LOC130135601 [Syzygium oleosum]|uniref:uncharacterized protein LOC130135601 n=1 Tax=Syzygium oleosum TaxID=219896 RepID=UPI0024B8AB95|nr:uncharacterized protein LOC130135601 [Syzygium oleosum]
MFSNVYVFFFLSYAAPQPNCCSVAARRSCSSQAPVYRSPLSLLSKVSLSTSFKFIIRVHRLGDHDSEGLSLWEVLSSVAKFGGQAFVMQDNVLITTLTVREAIHYTNSATIARLHASIREDGKRRNGNKGNGTARCHGRKNWRLGVQRTKW